MNFINTQKDNYAEKALIEAESLLRFKEDDSHVESVDDISKRKAIDEALSRAKLLGNLTADNIRTKKSFTNNKFIKRFAAAAAVAALVFWGISVFYFDSPMQKNRHDKTSFVSMQPDISTIVARVLKVSGDSGDAQNMVTGKIIDEGKSIVTKSESAVIGFNNKARIEMVKDTSMDLKKLRTDSVEIFLRRGEIKVAIEPDISGPDFTILTRLGKIFVTGTIFSVNVFSEDVKVSVIRGSVEITRNDGSSLFLRASESLSMKSDIVPIKSVHKVMTKNKSEKKTAPNKSSAMSLSREETHVKTSIKRTV